MRLENGTTRDTVTKSQLEATENETDSDNGNQNFKRKFACYGK